MRIDGQGRRAVAAIALELVAALAAVPAHSDGLIAKQTVPAGRWQDTTLPEYRQHLMDLTTLTAACAKGRDLKTCDPMLVGLDDRIPLGSGRRLVRYGWLRVLFSKAEEPDEAQAAPEAKKPETKVKESVLPEPETTSQLLQDAQTRLAQDRKQMDGPTVALPQHTAEQQAMKQVLAGREFRNLQQVSQQDSTMEKVGNWLNHFFESLGKMRARSAWVGRALVWGFITAVGVGLIWGLLQLERRWRIRLVPESDGPAAGAASARDWQLWLADARAAAAKGLWREAIHFVYWATISRLESKRLWPADRARTPREYLALVATDDPRKGSLASLTGGFELSWYGGRPASESDYRTAENLAAGLIAGGSEGGGR
jgi:hypothetical protein